MELNSEVVEGILKTGFYKRVVFDSILKESGIITEAGRVEDNLYVEVTFRENEKIRYSSKEFGRLYVEDE
jgi:hypothetical protein